MRWDLPIEVLMLILDDSVGTLPVDPGTYTPSLDFSDDRNSQYFVMGWP